MKKIVALISVVVFTAVFVYAAILNKKAEPPQEVQPEYQQTEDMILNEED